MDLTMTTGLLDVDALLVTSGEAGTSQAEVIDLDAEPAIGSFDVDVGEAGLPDECVEITPTEMTMIRMDGVIKRTKAEEHKHMVVNCWTYTNRYTRGNADKHDPLPMPSAKAPRRSAILSHWAVPKMWERHSKAHRIPSKAVKYFPRMTVGSKLMIIIFDTDDSLWRGAQSHGTTFLLEVTDIHSWHLINFPKLCPLVRKKLGDELVYREYINVMKNDKGKDVPVLNERKMIELEFYCHLSCFMRRGTPSFPYFAKRWNWREAENQFVRAVAYTAIAFEDHLCTVFHSSANKYGLASRVTDMLSSDDSTVLNLRNLFHDRKRLDEMTMMEQMDL